MKNDFKKFDTWIRKNWFTVLGIIIILGVLWIDLVTVQEQKSDIAKECNEYWQEELERVCPALSEDLAVGSGFFEGDIELG